MNFTVENILRPCYVDGKKALFHRWINKEQILMKAKETYTASIYDLERAYKNYERSGCIPCFVNIDKVNNTLALVEYENGDIAEVHPTSIQFADDKIKEYEF